MAVLSGVFFPKDLIWWLLFRAVLRLALMATVVLGVVLVLRRR